MSLHSRALCCGFPTRPYVASEPIPVCALGGHIHIWYCHSPYLPFPSPSPRLLLPLISPLIPLVSRGQWKMTRKRRKEGGRRRRIEGRRRVNRERANTAAADTLPPPTDRPPHLLHHFLSPHPRLWCPLQHFLDESCCPEGKFPANIHRTTQGRVVHF